MSSYHHVVACQGGASTILERRPVPALEPGQLLLGLRAVGLCGTDLFKLAHGLAPTGTVLGHEVVGEVLAAGAGVAAFAPGERIVVPHHVACGNCPLCTRGNETMCEQFRENLLLPGAFAELIVVGRRAVEVAARKIPPQIRDDCAVFVEPAACVARGVMRSGLHPTGISLIQGGGTMGLLHLLVLQFMQPDSTSLVVDPLPERRALARRLGAAWVAAPGREASEVLDQASNGLGADVVFDTVGGAAALSAGLAATREGGTVVLFAHAPEGEEASLPLNELFKFERRIVATYSGGLEEQALVFGAMIDKRFDPSVLVSHHLPLDRFDEGVALSRSQRALKVVYSPVGSEGHRE